MRTPIRILASLCLLSASAAGPVAAAVATVAHLDQPRQTMEAFAASDCWLGDYVGRYFSATMRERAAKLLFATSFNRGGSPEGIGLSAWRVNVGAGSATQGADSNIDDPMRRTECFLNADGTYDWTRSPGQQWFMQRARDYGVRHFVLFSNSAPISLTANGKACKTSFSLTANLRDDAYDDFADFLATVAGHFAAQGCDIAYISPVNEPQYEWMGGQEGSPWQNTEVTRLALELDNALTRHGLDTKIMIPEAGKWTYLTDSNILLNNYGYNQIEQFFNPDNTATYVGQLPHIAQAVAGHSYWTFRTNDELAARRTAVASAAARRGLQVMQTEWSMLDEPPMASAGFPAGGYDEATYMDIALYMAKVIYCDLVMAQASSWSYWTAFAQEQWGQKNRFYLLRVTAAGDTGPESYGDLSGGGTLVDSRNLWVLGNYSRFIRPGYRRVELTGASDLNGLMGSAYVAPDGKELVVVYVNMSHTATAATVATAGDVSRQPLSIGTYTTSESLALHYDRNLDTGDTGQEIEIPARSVVTVVMQLGQKAQPATGDLNGDGRIDIDDVNQIINIVLGKANAIPQADLNGDGSTDIDDVNAMVNIVLGAHM